jgi:hypothetical protein
MTAETLNVHEVEIELLSNLSELVLLIVEWTTVWIVIEPELQIGGETEHQIVDDQCHHIDVDPADPL